MRPRFLLLIVFSVLLAGCLKDGDKTVVLPLPDGKIPYSVICENLQDSLTGHGFIIHEGVTPPTINGSYLVSPMQLEYASDQAPAAYVNLVMTFSEQIQRGVLKYGELQNTDVENIPVPGSSIEANVIGSGNDFTMFCYQTLTQSADSTQQWRVKTATLVSGTLTDSGIANCQYANIILEREINDSSYLLSFPPDSTYRLFRDGDSLSGKL